MKETYLKKQIEDLEAERDQLKEEYEAFAYIISHDLSAPFRQIEGFAQLIQENGLDQLDPKSRRHFEYILKGAKKGQDVIAGLLEFSRLNTIQYDHENLDTNILVDEVTTELEHMIVSKGAELKIDRLHPVRGARKHIHSLFHHLIRNALLYTDQDTKPLVKISSEQLYTKVNFTISDNGIGMGTRDWKELFLVLKRGVLEKEYPGIGMGLTLARKIVQLHGGDIWVEETGESGTTIRFTLPEVNETDEGC